MEFLEEIKKVECNLNCDKINLTLLNTKNTFFLLLHVLLVKSLMYLKFYLVKKRKRTETFPFSLQKK